MTASTTSNGDRTAPTNQDSDLLARGRSYVRQALGRGRTGTIALLVGGALLVRSRRAKTRGRGAIQALAGLGFLALGVRQRLARNGSFETRRREDSDGPIDGGDTGRHIDTAATTAHTQGEEANPRDVTEDPSGETETESDDGSVRFTTDQDDGPSSNPTLDDTEADPRVREDDGNGVDVDISESAMADEPSEAVGPQAEQAQPASTEATEPEPEPTQDEDTQGSSVDDSGEDSPESSDETDRSDAERDEADGTEKR